MKEVKIESTFTVFESLQDLTEDVKELMDSAIRARENAYSVYSNFSVGAAVKLENSEIITGNNQENAAYPSGLCAERTAIYYAGANYPGVKILQMVITASSNDHETEKPIPPCGACRQAIAEYEVNQDSPIEIYFMGKKGKVVRSHSLANLLPLIFDRSVL